jgi:SAM-dependent methyltransferase
VFPSGDITENFYDLSILPTRYGSVDHNYSEGYYRPATASPWGDADPANIVGDDYTISPSQAERNKFDVILKSLGAAPGDTILDCGCGTCSFGEYCRTRGIHVIGLTLSNEQVKLCHTKGVEAYHFDHEVYHPELMGRVDHVLVLGSSEHIDTGPHRDIMSYARKCRAMTDMLVCVSRYFSHTGREHRLFYSGLHLNPAYCDAWELVVLERAYGGTLMLNTPACDIQRAAEDASFTTVYRRDSTREYFLATALNENHFGNPSSPASAAMIALLAIGLVYPYALYMWVYYIFGLWMWMFDGRLHLHGADDFTLGTEQERPLTLWWYVGTYSRVQNSPT